jgi:hypothetical protein
MRSAYTNEQPDELIDNVRPAVLAHSANALRWHWRLSRTRVPGGQRTTRPIQSRWNYVNSGAGWLWL